ncbi:hypothetical protein CP09DC79_1098B, partial [Chlamydia psittaci 09DC79]
FMAWGMAACLN